MNDSTPALIATGYLRGLRVALVGLLVVLLLGWQLPTTMEFRQRYHPTWLEFAALGVLGAINLAVAIVILTDRPWGRWRWPLLGAALVASVIATAPIAAGDLFGPPHWSWEIFGWYAVVLLMDLPVPWFAVVLLSYLGITLAQALVAGQTDRRVLVEMVISTLVLAGWQFAVALAVSALQRSALDATRIAAEEEELRTEEQVAEQVHNDRKARYADLLPSTVPLLAGLASGDLRPEDSRVRQACVIEAARMRRLFAESDEVADALKHELEACIDSAERRGVSVQLALRGSRPVLSRMARRALTEPVIAVLAGTRARARVTVVSIDDQVVVSVVSDRVQPGLTDRVGLAENSARALEPSEGNVTVSWLTRQDGLWLDAIWQPVGSSARVFR